MVETLKEIYVDLETDSYTIFIENNILAKVSSILTSLYTGAKIVIVTDEMVAGIYANSIMKQLSDHYEMHLITIPSGEKYKTIATVNDLCTGLSRLRVSRSDLIIALGGGVVGDIVGFVASIYLRGVKFIQIPTTLLSQVDSSVGGKVGVNLESGKNLIGSFYQPKAVIIDPLVLNTLPASTFFEGMAEVVKYGCILDADFFSKLEQLRTQSELMSQIEEIIHKCCDIKRRVVEDDVYDTSKRMLLNFGHTFAHAIESVAGYGEISHGEAVAIGMVMITKISEENKITEAKTAKRIENLLQCYELPTRLLDFDYESLIDSIMQDKKNLNSALNLIFLTKIGEGIIYPADVEFLRGACKNDY